MSFTGPHKPEAIERMRASANKRWAKKGERAKQSDRSLEFNMRASRKAQARGVKIGNRLGAMVYFEEDTFAAVRRQAVKEGRSFSEIVRTYVEWGLDTEGQT